MAFVSAENGDGAEAEEPKEKRLMRHRVLDPEEFNFLDVLAENSRDDPDALGGDDVFNGAEVQVSHSGIDQGNHRIGRSRLFSGFNWR